jgi:hypothetical protein
MQLLHDPQTWVSFLTLSLLEIVLGIDNIIFLSILVERLPKPKRSRARILGLGFAMLTRIALLLSITWVASLRKPLLTVLGTGVSGRNLILFAGGLFLLLKTITEIRAMLTGQARTRKPGAMDGFLMIILQIGIIDIVFSFQAHRGHDCGHRGLGARDDDCFLRRQPLHRSLPDHQGVGFGVPGVGGCCTDRRITGVGYPARLFVRSVCFLRDRRMDKHPAAKAQSVIVC